MNAAKRERLEEAGYHVTTVADFLGLTTEESDLIEIKLDLTYALRKQRKVSGLSQTDLAERLGSSQSRVAKMEAGDPGVSIELLIRALLATGITRDDLATVMAGQTSQPLSVPVAHMTLPTMQSDFGHYKFETDPKRPTPNPYSGSKRLPKVQVG